MWDAVPSAAPIRARRIVVEHLHRLRQHPRRTKPRSVCGAPTTPERRAPLHVCCTCVPVRPRLRRPRRLRPPRRGTVRAGHHLPLPDPVRHAAGLHGRARRARPRPHRLRQDAGLRAARREPPAVRHDHHPDLQASPRAGPGADPRAGHPDRRGRPAARGDQRPHRHHGVRWRAAGPPDPGPQPRRRHRHRLPRSARGPDGPARGLPRPGPHHGPRRGRPHGRPRLPACRDAHPRRHARRHPADAVQRHAGQRRRQAGAAATCATRAPTRWTPPSRPSRP